MGPSLVLEKMTFLRDGVWRERRFRGLVTVLTGAAGAGKSTPLEAVFYILGLDGLAVMPEVRACERLELIFRVAGSRWTAARGGAAAPFVEFTPLDGKAPAPAVRLPVKRGRGEEQTASDFFLGLLDLPVFGHESKRLGLRHLHRLVMLRQKAISNTYLDGLSAEDRELLFEVVLGLRDKELDGLESESARAESRFKERSTFRRQFLRQREIHDLASPGQIREEAAHRQQEHQAAAAAARQEQQRLGELAAARGVLDFEAEQAKASYGRAREAADREGRALADAQREHARAEGVVEGLVRRQERHSRCTACGQDLPRRAPGRCVQCDQPVAGGGSGAGGGDLEQARARVQVLAVGLERCRAQAQAAEGVRERAWAQAAEGVRERAWAQVQGADQARAAHEREVWRPQQQRVLEAEKRASALGGEVAQLGLRLEEVEIVFALDAELEVLEQARKAAKEALDAASGERTRRRKDILATWSALLLARVRAIDPTIGEAFITEGFEPFVDGKPFDDSSVSGGPKTLRNLCVLLSLRDLGRVVPTVLVPPLMIVDSPLSGFGAQGVDARIGERLMDQIIEVAADPSPDGYACQLIVATNDPLPGPRTGVHEIALGPGERFFDDAPACAAAPC